MIESIKNNLKCLQIHSLLFVLLIFLTKQLEALDNTTKQFESLDEEHLLKGRFLGFGDKTKPKFITFNTLDEEISVEMTLGVPFLTIPVNKKTDNGGVLNQLSSVNINAAALAMTFGITVSTIYLAPLIGKLFSKTISNKKEKQRSIEDDGSFLGSILQILDEQGIPVQDCVQRTICTLVKRSIENQSPTSSDKIIDGIASNNWLMSRLKGTLILEAINAGKSLSECFKKYSKCKVNHSALQTMAYILDNNIN